METWQELVVERVRELEPGAPARLPAARRWWLASAYAGLLEAGRLPGGLDAGAVRAATWESLELSARRLVLAGRTLVPVLERYQQARRLEPRLQRWCGDLCVAVWGSLATFDAMSASDFDVALVVQTDRPARAEPALNALVVWPWKLELLAERGTRRLWPAGLDFDDPGLLFSSRATVMPHSRDPGKHESLAVLMTATRPLAGGELLGEVVRAWERGPGLPRRQLAAAWRRRLRRIEGKLAGRGSGEEQWRRWLSATRMYLTILAVLELERPAWGLGALGIAERLVECDSFRTRERETIGRAALWTAHGRSAWVGAPEGSQARQALAAFRELRALADRPAPLR